MLRAKYKHKTKAQFFEGLYSKLAGSSLVIWNKYKNNSEWVMHSDKNEKINPGEERQTIEVQAGLAEFCNLLGPPESVPKTRVVPSSTNGETSFSLISKKVPGFKSSSLRHLSVYTPEQLNFAAASLAIMHAVAEYDLNIENVCLRTRKRIDFEIAAYGWGNSCYYETKYSFSGLPCTPQNAFNIDRVDYQIFPNCIIAQPSNIFDLKKRYREDLNVLTSLQNNDEFLKTADQYFLKTLLFDVDLIVPALRTHMSDGDAQSLAKYLNQRFNEMKKALVQVPRFRKNIKNSFKKEYKDNIINEFKANNQYYQAKADKHLAKYHQVQHFESLVKHQYYLGRVVPIDKIEKKLIALHEMVNACESISQGNDLDDKELQKFKSVFGGTAYNRNNRFHQYAMQMVLAIDVAFDQDKLLLLVKRDIQVKFNYLQDVLNGNHFEKHLHTELKKSKDFCDSIGNPLRQAECLFYINCAVEELLLERDQNRWQGIATDRTLKDTLKALPYLPEEIKFDFDLIEKQQSDYKHALECLQTLANQYPMLRSLLSAFPNPLKDQSLLVILTEFANKSIQLFNLDASDYSDYDSLLKKIPDDSHFKSLKDAGLAIYYLAFLKHKEKTNPIKILEIIIEALKQLTSDEITKKRLLLEVGINNLIKPEGIDLSKKGLYAYLNNVLENLTLDAPKDSYARIVMQQVALKSIELVELAEPQQLLKIYDRLIDNNKNELSENLFLAMHSFKSLIDLKTKCKSATNSLNRLVDVLDQLNLTALDTNAQQLLQKILARTVNLTAENVSSEDLAAFGRLVDEARSLLGDSVAVAMLDFLESQLILKCNRSHNNIDELIKYIQQNQKNKTIADYLKFLEHFTVGDQYADVLAALTLLINSNDTLKQELGDTASKSPVLAFLKTTAADLKLDPQLMTQVLLASMNLAILPDNSVVQNHYENLIEEISASGSYKLSYAMRIVFAVFTVGFTAASIIVAPYIAVLAVFSLYNTSAMHNEVKCWTPLLNRLHSIKEDPLEASVSLTSAPKTNI